MVEKKGLFILQIYFCFSKWQMKQKIINVFTKKNLQKKIHTPNIKTRVQGNGENGQNIVRENEKHYV